MKKLTLILFIISMIFSACSDSKKWIGKINGKTVFMKEYSQTLTEKYAYPIERLRARYVELPASEAEKALRNDLKQIFKTFYTAMAFTREAEKSGFFKDSIRQKRIAEFKKDILVKMVEEMLWKKDIKPLLTGKYSETLSEKDYQPFQKQILLSHILFTFKKHGETKALKKTRALRKKIVSGSISFSKAAGQYSEDPGSKFKAGDLGWADQETPFVTEFKKAAFKLNKGQVSNPVKTPYGYHLILVRKIKHRAISELKNNSQLTRFIKKQKKDFFRAKSVAVAQQYTNRLKSKFKNKIQCDTTPVFTYFDQLKKFIKAKHPELLANQKSGSGKYDYIVFLKEQILAKAPIILQKFHETFPDKIFCKVEGANSMNVYELAAVIGKQLPAKFLNQKELLMQFLTQNFIEVSLRFLDGKAKGYHLNPAIRKQINFAVVQFKGDLFRDFIQPKIRMAAEKKVCPGCIMDYYNKNKKDFENPSPKTLGLKDMDFFMEQLKNQKQKNAFLALYEKSDSTYQLKKGISKEQLWNTLKNTSLERYKKLGKVAPEIKKILTSEKELEEMNKLSAKLLKKYGIEVNSKLEAINLK